MNEFAQLDRDLPKGGVETKIAEPLGLNPVHKDMKAFEAVCLFFIFAPIVFFIILMIISIKLAFISFIFGILILSLISRIH